MVGKGKGKAAAVTGGSSKSAKQRGKEVIYDLLLHILHILIVVLTIASPPHGGEDFSPGRQGLIAVRMGGYGQGLGERGWLRDGYSNVRGLFSGFFFMSFISISICRVIGHVVVDIACVFLLCRG